MRTILLFLILSVSVFAQEFENRNFWSKGSNGSSIILSDTTGNVVIGGVSTTSRFGVHKNGYRLEIEPGGTALGTLISEKSGNNIDFNAFSFSFKSAAYASPGVTITPGFGGSSSTTRLSETGGNNLQITGYTINLMYAGTTSGLYIKEDGRIGIGNTSLNASAKLDVTSTTQGVLLPRMTTTQKNAISTPAEGLIVYDTTLHKLCVYNGSAWETITSAP